MSNINIKKVNYRNNLLLQITIFCSLGLAVGVASVWFPPVYVLGALVIFPLAYIIIRRPEIALLGILIATSSIVFEDALPIISIGISFHIPDILLLGLLGLVIVRRIFDPNFRFVRTPLDLPLILFISMMLIATILAVLQTSVEVEVARRAARFIFYYLTFFIVTNLVKNRSQLNLLLNGIFFLATLVAGVMVAQFILGQSVTLLPGRVESLWTQGVVYSDITRILPPGLSVVLAAFITIFCILVVEMYKTPGLLKYFQLGLMGLAIIFTFLRSYWAALIIIFSIIVIIVKGQDRRRLVGWFSVSSLIGIVILLLVSNNPGSRADTLLDASMDRLNSVFRSETFEGQDESMNWRAIENQYAINQILSHPLLGLGMEARYRPWDSRIDQGTVGSTYDFRRHIHNGHLEILVQSGLLGYLSLAWLSTLFIVRGFRNWRVIANSRFRGVVLGFTLVYLAVAIAAVANSSFTQWRWTPVIGILMGVNEVILQLMAKQTAVPSERQITSSQN